MVMDFGPDFCDGSTKLDKPSWQGLARLTIN